MVLAVSLLLVAGWSGGVQVADGPEIDLAKRPFVIFHPAPPRPESKPDIPLPDGADDYYDLFKADAPWRGAPAPASSARR